MRTRYVLPNALLGLISITMSLAVASQNLNRPISQFELTAAGSAFVGIGLLIGALRMAFIELLRPRWPFWLLWTALCLMPTSRVALGWPLTLLQWSAGPAAAMHDILSCGFTGSFRGAGVKVYVYPIGVHGLAALLLSAAVGSSLRRGRRRDPHPGDPNCR